MQFSTILVIAFSAIGLASSVHKRQTPPPLNQTYVTARPACNITGFTEIPGNYTETIYQESGATLESCMEACEANSTCKSIAYSYQYTECLFYDHYANEIQLWEDDESDFDHFDEGCDVCEYPQKKH